MFFSTIDVVSKDYRAHTRNRVTARLLRSQLLASQKMSFLLLLKRNSATLTKRLNSYTFPQVRMLLGL